VQRLKLQTDVANFEGDKLTGQAKSHENLGKCPRYNHKVSATALKQNKWLPVKGKSSQRWCWPSSGLIKVEDEDEDEGNCV
jgi:hypothetical protein